MITLRLSATARIVSTRTLRIFFSIKKVYEIKSFILLLVWDKSNMYMEYERIAKIAIPDGKLFVRLSVSPPIILQNVKRLICKVHRWLFGFGSNSILRLDYVSWLVTINAKRSNLIIRYGHSRIAPHIQLTFLRPVPYRVSEFCFKFTESALITFEFNQIVFIEFRPLSYHQF